MPTLAGVSRRAPPMLEASTAVKEAAGDAGIPLATTHEPTIATSTSRCTNAGVTRAVERARRVRPVRNASSQRTEHATSQALQATASTHALRIARMKVLLHGDHTAMALKVTADILHARDVANPTFPGRLGQFPHEFVTSVNFPPALRFQEAVDRCLIALLVIGDRLEL